MGRKVSTNRLDRASVFARKWVEGFVQGLRPPAILSRFNGPRILINSVPKAGTHLLETTLARFPQLRFCGRPTLIGWSDYDRTRVQQALRGIKRGSFHMGRDLFSERSATSRQGRIGAWKEELHPQHKAAIKRHFGSLLLELGYEKAREW